ncbi:Tetratricopeptide repeat-containing protein [Loktanella fryxellensis]|uniref:Tetratricopeptide repeat-containing protein n=2 Tax=Loktanella fryxellensis TaxID=245187 RepID=A0A1H8GIQ5_9RHOB|nr:Tetratricopeptide repeat-containing protein [Loktanella fryxellensis]
MPDGGTAPGFEVPQGGAPDAPVTDDAPATPAPGAPGADAAALDALFAELADADPEATPGIQNRIAEMWSRSGSTAMDLLLRRGADAMAAGDTPLAIQHYSALIDHAPEFAEGYNGRATAFYLAGQIGPSLADIQTTLALNPRHFGAMSGLAVILEELDRPEDALEVYDRILGIAPHAEGVADAARRLTVTLDGLAL